MPFDMLQAPEPSRVALSAWLFLLFPSAASEAGLAALGGYKLLRTAMQLLRAAPQAMELGVLVPVMGLLQHSPFLVSLGERT